MAKVNIDSLLKEIQKKHGQESIMLLGDKPDLNLEVISSGSIALDIGLGVGGYPKGRIIEIYGPESSGKTTLALHAIAQTQKKGETAAFIDAEHALDPVYAQALGIDLDKLIISQPDTGEQALDIAESLIRSGQVGMVVIDSVAALVPKAEIEGDMGDSHMGLQARLMSQALRKLSGIINRSNTTAIFINQLREKIGIMFGNPETTPGGKALKFYSTMRLEVRRGTQVKTGVDISGHKTNVKIVKNKVAPPFKTVELDIVFGEGVSRLGEIIDLATNLELIDKAGSWYSYQDQKIGQGKDTVKDFLKTNPEIADLLETKIKEHYFKNEGEQ